MKREDFVLAAREYVGTPFHLQGRVKGVGVDCGGLFVLAARDCGYTVQDVQGYTAVLPKGLLWRTISPFCVKITADEVQAGDIGVFCFSSEPQHIAIVSGILPDVSLIHAHMSVGVVCETHMGAAWRRRLYGFYQLKGIE